jgi:hypothetical protein
MTQVFRFISLVAAQMLLFGFVAVSSAENQTFAPVAVCQFTRFADEGKFGAWGEAYTESTQNRPTIACAVGQDQTLDTNDSLRVYYDDFNNNSYDNFVCEVREVTKDWGTINYAGPRHGCSTAGGCQGDGPASYVGPGYILFENIRHGGSWFSVVECTIPKMEEDPYISILLSLHIVENSGT